MEARAGFEPANDGFANRCLSQLGDRAVDFLIPAARGFINKATDKVPKK